MTTQTVEPKTPSAKPHGTTPIEEKEAQGKVESPSADRMEGAPGPAAPTPEEAAGSGGDQDIDTAGTEADDHR